MIGLDTNILVRLLVKDDIGQMEQAQRFVDENCTPDAPAFINCIVLAELVWVLESVYRFSRSEIAAAVEKVLAGSDRVIEHRGAVLVALDDFRTTGIGFGDALIGQINRARGCEATATFDRKAAKLTHFLRVT